MTRLLTIGILSSFLALGCTDDSEPQPTDDNARSFRATEASTEVITLSATAADALVAGTSLSAFDESDLAGTCGAMSGDLSSLTLDFSGCPGMSGSLSVALSDPSCVLGAELDPACLDNLSIDVNAALDIDGVSIDGAFSVQIADDLVAAAGSLTVTVAGDALDVDFDLEITDNITCDTINGTLDVSSVDGDVSVVANDLVDCGDCPESGSLSVTADGEFASIDFDNGVIDVNGDLGEFTDALSCDLAL